MQMEQPEPHNESPEVPCQQRNIKERRTGQPIQNRHEAVKQRQNECVSGKIASNLPIPRRGAETRAVEYPRLSAVDQHPPEPQLSDNLVHGAFGDEELLRHVAEAVERRAQQRKEIALQCVGCGVLVRTRYVVGCQHEPETRDADQYPHDLRPVVADFQEEEGQHHDNDDGPELDQLRGQDRCISVRQHGEIVALHVAEGEDDVFPPIFQDQPAPLCEPVAIPCVSRVYDCQEDVVEQGLEGRDTGPFIREEGAECVRTGIAEGEDLAQRQDDPEFLRLEESQCVSPGLLLRGRIVVCGAPVAVASVVGFVEALVEQLGGAVYADGRHLGTLAAGRGGAAEVNAGCTDGDFGGVFRHGWWGGSWDQYVQERKSKWSFWEMSERKTPEVAHCVERLWPGGTREEKGKRKNAWWVKVNRWWRIFAAKVPWCHWSDLLAL
jgi:hypothetical protein